MTDLFETGAEAARDQIYVVSQALRGCEHPVIRHHHRSGIVIGKMCAGETTRHVGPESAIVDHPVQNIAAFQQADFDRELKHTSRFRQDFGQQHAAAMTVVAAQGVRHHIDGHHIDPDLKRTGQMPGQPREHRLAHEGSTVVQRFSRFLEFGIVIPVPGKKIADFFDRRPQYVPGQTAPVAGELFGKFGRVVAGFPPGMKKLVDRFRRCRTGRRHVLDLRIADPVVEQWIAKHFLQLRHRACFAAAGKFLQVDFVGVGEFQKGLRCQRTLIPLDQIQVTGRNPEVVRHSGLGKPPFRPYAPDPLPGKKFLVFHIDIRKVLKGLVFS